MILLVDQAADNQLGTLVRALYPQYPNLYVLNRASDIEDCPSNAIIILVPRLEDATYLNFKRPLFGDRAWRVILYCTSELSIALAKEAPDFFDWISRRVECQPAPTPHALFSLRAALCARSWAIGYRGKALESLFQAAFPSRTWIKESVDMPYDELVATIQSAGRAYILWSNIAYTHNLERLRWATIDAGRRSRAIIEMASSEHFELWTVDDKTAPLDQAIQQLSGAPSPGRLAALLHLEADAIPLAAGLLAQGIDALELESQLAGAPDPGAALARLVLQQSPAEPQTVADYRAPAPILRVLARDDRIQKMRKAKAMPPRPPDAKRVFPPATSLQTQNEAPEPAAQIQDSADKHLPLAQRYRLKIFRFHNRLRTLGIPPETRKRENANELPLDQLFIPLRLIPQGGGYRDGQSFHSILDKGRSAVILADPGMGKSTLLAYIALLYSRGNSLKDFWAPPQAQALPFYISLREYLRRHGADPKLGFVEYLTVEAQERHGLKEIAPAFFKDFLQKGEAIVLFDGLDEVGSEAARLKISQEIQAFHREFKKCPFWISSRIYGYTDKIRLPEDDFVHYHIDRLDNEQIDAFVGHWYSLQIPQDPLDAKEQAESLRAAIHRTPSVQRLAGNPLLLTLMAFIHHGLRKLPKDRGELYEKCVEMLLKTWQEAKRREGEGPRGMGGLHLHVPAQKDYLGHLAFYVQQKTQGDKDEDARGLVSRNEALDILTARHLGKAQRDRPKLSHAEARAEMERFLDYVCDETGLLIDRGNGQLSFIHLSFQEYLAAWVFVQGTDLPRGPEFFVEHLGDPAWEEVLLLRLYIVLRAGGGGESEFDRIIEALFEVLEGEHSIAPEAWLTMARALRDDLDFTETDRRRIVGYALSYWLESSSFEGMWFRALEELKLFSPRGCDTLRAMLADAITNAQLSPADVIACLHLESELFGFPRDAAFRLKERADFKELLADLVGFRGEPGIGVLLEEYATLKDWFTAVRALDGQELYWMSLDFPISLAPAAIHALIVLLWEKVLILGPSDKSGSRFCRSRFSEVAFPLLTFHASHQASLPRVKLSSKRLLCQHLGRKRRIGEIKANQALLQGTAWFIQHLLSAFKTAEPLDGSAILKLAKRAIHDGFLLDVEKDVMEDNYSYVRSVGSTEWPFSRPVGLTYEFYVEFGQTFGCKFGQHFLGEFVRYFGYDFDRTFPPDFWLNVREPGWQAKWEAALRDVDSQQRLIGNDDFWDRANSTRRKVIGEKLGNLDTPLLQLKNPLALPFFLGDLWTICAEISARRPRGGHHHPLSVYLLALAWPEYQKNAPPLTGPAGALFIAHAAFAALITGLECPLPSSPDLNDARIRFSYHLHQIAHFKDAQTHADGLLHEIANAGPELKPLLELIGL